MQGLGRRIAAEQAGGLALVQRFHPAELALDGAGLPAGGFSWRPSITDSMEKIRHLNARVQAYAKANKIPYVDYFSAMLSEDGTCMNPAYANDNPGVHPNAEGYRRISRVLIREIQRQWGVIT